MKKDDLEGECRELEDGGMSREEMEEEAAADDAGG